MTDRSVFALRMVGSSRIDTEVSTMTLKKQAATCAIVGICALVIAVPTSVPQPEPAESANASSVSAAQTDQPAQTEPAPELPVGDATNALTSMDGESLLGETAQDGDGEDPSRVANMIVQLQDGADREGVLASINEAVASDFPGARAQVSHEYVNTFAGFALSAPVGAMDAIRGVNGVAGAFLDREMEVSEETGESDTEAVAGAPSTRRGNNLSGGVLMNADRLAYNGEGTVVAIIDTGVELAHPAFSAPLRGTPAMSAKSVAAVTPQLGDGKSGAYVSEKFPFVYDYADNDSDVSPADAHGTHVAGITAGNSGQIVGVAPDAQIVVAKVARSQDRIIPDSAMLAALDDMAVLHPDVVNLSIGGAPGMDSAADTLYAGVFESLRDKGIIVDVSAGNSRSAGFGNKSGKGLPFATDPDSSTVNSPASFAPVLAVASVDNAVSGSPGDAEMSHFSSWGVSPDLRLKPEVAAPGGSIYSAVPGGDYQYMSGTSMAAPQVTGLGAVVLQRVQSDPLFASMSARQQADVVQNLIMGTARPLTDAAQASGALYSPRKQGAGLVDALAATTSSVYPTVVGAAEQSRPKADLGDGTKGWHFDVTLHNLSGVPATYELSSQALSEIVDGGFFTEHSSDWRGHGVEITYSGAASASAEGAMVTVPASGEATVGIDVTPGSEFASYVADNTPNGTFLDGFVRFASKTEGQPDLAVPYLGFYGDWGKAPIFDALTSDGGEHVLASGIYNGSNGALLGYNPLVKVSDRQGKPRSDKYVISRSTASGAPTILEPRTGTLRSVHSLTTTYANQAGATIASILSHQNVKSTLIQQESRMRWVEKNHETRAINLNSPAYANLPDGTYTLRIAASNDGPSSAQQSISYNFRVDTKAPVIDKATLRADGSGLDVEISDESPLAGFTLNDPKTGRWFYRDILSNDANQSYENGRYHYRATLTRGEIDSAWSAMGDEGATTTHPYVLAWDYGLNYSQAARLDLSSSNGGNNAGQPVDNGHSTCTPSSGGQWGSDGYRWWWACSNGSGYLRNGWYQLGGRYYYFGADGYMHTGWLNWGGSWYYLGSNGVMLTGTQVINGRTYVFGANGVWLR